MEGLPLIVELAELLSLELDRGCNSSELTEKQLHGGRVDWFKGSLIFDISVGYYDLGDLIMISDLLLLGRRRTSAGLRLAVVLLCLGTLLASYLAWLIRGQLLVIRLVLIRGRHIPLLLGFVEVRDEVPTFVTQLVL